MEPFSIVILIVACVMIVEVLLLLVRLKVEKVLLLMPGAGAVLEFVAFALYEYRDKLLSPVSESVRPVIIYLVLVAGIVLGMISIVIWLRGEREAKSLISAAKSIDGAVTRIESEVQSSGMEIEHFDEEMGDIKKKIADYESREKEVE